MIATLTRLKSGFSENAQGHPSLVTRERMAQASKDMADAAQMLHAAFEIIGGLTGDCPKFRHRIDAMEWLETYSGIRLIEREK